MGFSTLCDLPMNYKNYRGKVLKISNYVSNEGRSFRGLLVSNWEFFGTVILIKSFDNSVPPYSLPHWNLERGTESFRRGRYWRFFYCQEMVSKKCQ